MRHRRDETVAAARIGDDVTIFAPLFPQSLAQRRDTLRQVVLFHRGAVPDFLEELFLSHGLPRTGDQQEERTERLGGQRNSRPGAQEHPLPRQKLEITEAIFLDRFGRHLRNSLKTGTFRKIQNALRTSQTSPGNKSVYVNPIFIGLEGDR